MPGGVIGVRLPVEDENADEPWKMTPSRRRQAPPVKDPLPDSINVVLADQVYIDRTGLPPSLVAQLVRIAAFQNPEFYRAQAMRLPTYGKPRIISCAELHPRHVALPRGCLDEAIELIKANGAKPQFVDERQRGTALDVTFLGNFTTRRQQPSLHSSRTTWACSPPRQDSVKPWSAPARSQHAASTRSCSCIGGNWSTNGANG